MYRETEFCTITILGSRVLTPQTLASEHSNKEIDFDMEDSSSILEGERLSLVVNGDSEGSFCFPLTSES